MPLTDWHDNRPALKLATSITDSGEFTEAGFSSDALQHRPLNSVDEERVFRYRSLMVFSNKNQKHESTFNNLKKRTMGHFCTKESLSYHFETMYHVRTVKLLRQLFSLNPNICVVGLLDPWWWKQLGYTDHGNLPAITKALPYWHSWSTHFTSNCHWSCPHIEKHTIKRLFVGESMEKQEAWWPNKLCCNLNSRVLGHIIEIH